MSRADERQKKLKILFQSQVKLAANILKNMRKFQIGFYHDVQVIRWRCLLTQPHSYNTEPDHICQLK